MAGQHAGKAIADILAETLRKHSEATSDARMEEGIAHRTEQAERWEAELRDVLRPAFEALGADDTDEAMTQIVHDWIVNPDHQVQLLAVVFALIPLVMGFVNAYEKPWISSVEQLAWRHDTNQPLTISDAVDAVIRGHITQAQGADHANNQGLNSDLFAVLCETAGNPPGPQTLGEAARRGLITEDQFTQGIRQGDTRNEWASTLWALRYTRMTPDQAIEAYVQDALPEDTARALAQEGGLDSRDFDPLYALHGNPPGVETLMQLWRRGRLTQAQVEQGIREGRTKNKYIDALTALKEAIPPERSIPTLVSSGAITEAQGITWLEWHGYDATTAKAMVEAHKSTTAAGHKHLAVSQIVTYYGEGEWSRAEAESRIVALGYTAADAGVILELEDIKVRKAIESAAISKARTLYLARKADAAEVSTLLDTAGVPASVRTQYLRVWEAELKASVAILTPAQVLSAWKFNVIHHAECLSRLEAHGYSTADAEILMQVETNAPKFQGT